MAGDKLNGEMIMEKKLEDVLVMQQVRALQSKFWECECCGSLIVTNHQDDAGEYICSQCNKAGCEHGGQYQEITIERFCKEAGIDSYQPTKQMPKSMHG